MRRALILAGSVLGLALAVPLLAAEENFHWRGELAPGATVEIKNTNGAIVATGTSGREVEVEAVKKGRRSDPAEVKIEVVKHAGGVTICAVYPGEGAPNECKPGEGGRMKLRHNDVSVKFQVRVPEGVRFVGRSVNGGVSASGITADAEASTVNGSIELDATGTARGETVNGGISARLGRADWDGTLALKTVNGGIDLTLPPGLSADVKARTVNGEIRTDFPISVQGTIGHHRLEGRIGNGGRLLELETVNGSIELRKPGAGKS
jgi:hypothetical protein